MRAYQNLQMFNNQQEATWISAELHYNGKLEHFLAKSVKPLIDSIIQTGIANRYFFVRFFDNSQYIKLRFQSNENNINSLIKPHIQEHFKEVYKHKTDTPISQKVDNLLFDNYEPEIKRFGGMYGMSIAEQHFEASSNVVLSFINEKVKSWNYETALGSAIQIQLGFAHKLGMNINECIEFFRYYYQLTLHFNLQNTSVHKADLLKFFDEGFSYQEKQLTGFHSKMWTLLEDNSTFDDEYYNKWLSQCGLTKDYYADAFNNFDIDYHIDEVLVSTINEVSDYKLFLWPQFANLLHLTNNRLGIHNRDESFLAYVMFKSLDKI
jgi:thiopeptide-type bacteriocin biosynthesis protein